MKKNVLQKCVSHRSMIQFVADMSYRPIFWLNRAGTKIIDSLTTCCKPHQTRSANFFSLSLTLSITYEKHFGSMVYRTIKCMKANIFSSGKMSQWV